MRPAGVLRNVSAQATGALAGRIRSVSHAELADMVVQVQVDYPRLHQCSAVDRIHLQDSIHARKGDLEAVGRRDGAAAEAGAAASADNRDAGLVGQRHNLAYFLGVRRQNDRSRHRAVNGAVVFVHQQVFAVIDYIIITNDGSDFSQ